MSLKPYQVVARPIVLIGVLIGTVWGVNSCRNSKKDEQATAPKVTDQHQIREPQKKEENTANPLLDQVGIGLMLFKYDKDGDKKLSEEEILAIVRKQMDKDKDGYLSMDELVKAKKWLNKYVCE